MDLPQRHYPVRFAPFEFANRSIIIFVTLCTKDRRPLLARPAAVTTIVDAWQRADQWQVGRYVILPDHIHLFCAPGIYPARPLRSWIRFWQNTVTRNWPWTDEKPVWQKDAWDRQLRRGEAYSSKWEYVRNNPVRHDLVERADEWPYQGEMHVLHWHDA